MKILSRTNDLFEVSSSLGMRRAGSSFVNEGVYDETGHILGTDEVYRSK